MVFLSHGYWGEPCRWLTWLLASGDLVSLHSLSYLWVSGRRRRYFWRTRLPPQSFLPLGIGEATPLMPYTGDVSNVLYWRRFQRLGDAWCDQPVDFGLCIDLDFDSGLHLGRDTCRSGKLKVSPAPSTWHFPYGLWDLPSPDLILTFSELLTRCSHSRRCIVPLGILSTRRFLNVNQ